SEDDCELDRYISPSPEEDRRRNLGRNRHGDGDEGESGAEDEDELKRKEKLRNKLNLIGIDDEELHDECGLLVNNNNNNSTNHNHKNCDIELGSGVDSPLSGVGVDGHDSVNYHLRNLGLTAIGPGVGNDDHEHDINNASTSPSLSN